MIPTGGLVARRLSLAPYAVDSVAGLLGCWAAQQKLAHLLVAEPPQTEYWCWQHCAKQGHQDVASEYSAVEFAAQHAGMRKAGNAILLEGT